MGEPSGYAYVVRPGVTRTAWQRYVAEFPLRIVKRDGTVHAVENRETGVVYAAFFEPGEVSFSDGRSVRADGPLLVKVEERWGRCVVATADPLQRANTVALELSGWPLAEAGSDELFSWRVDLPQGNHTGATVVRYFSLVDGQLFDPDPVIALGDDWFRLPEGYLYRRMQPGWLFWAADQGWRYGRADRANSLFWWNPEEGGWFWRSAAVPDWRFAFADQRWERVGKR